MGKRKRKYARRTKKKRKTTQKGGFFMNNFVESIAESAMNGLADGVGAKRLKSNNFKKINKGPVHGLYYGLGRIAGRLGGQLK